MIDWKSKQNRDGGWAYNKGCSWTEPTVFVLLAQSVTQVDRPAFEAGLRFLYSTQRRDGGWSPQPGVAESTWVTALAALLPEEAIGAVRLKKALAWLEGQTGRESTWAYRLREMMSGNDSRNPAGWAWFPGAAAWVIPTSAGIMAFERALRRGESSSLRDRVNSGREYLAAHVCRRWRLESRFQPGRLGRDGDLRIRKPQASHSPLYVIRPDRRLIERGKAAGTFARHLGVPAGPRKGLPGFAWDSRRTENPYGHHSQPFRELRSTRRSPRLQTSRRKRIRSYEPHTQRIVGNSGGGHHLDTLRAILSRGPLSHAAFRFRTCRS